MAKKKNEEIASALNKFNLYSPEDQAAIQSVVEDYFTCREDYFTCREDDSEPIPELEGTFFSFFCVCVNGETIISITDLDCVNETIGSDEMNVMYEHEDDPESVDSGSDTEESPVPEVGMVTNSDMHEAALSRMSIMNFENQPADITDDQAISEFWTSGCGCSKWNGKNCVRQFSISFITGSEDAVPGAVSQ